MAKLFQIKRVNGISDDAVKAKTGKKWDEWFKVLDKAGARMMEHKEIAELVQNQLGLTPWWGQMVTVGYEQERGMRAKHQRGVRYEVDRSKTIDVPIETVWAAWHDPEMLARWLPETRFEVTKSTPPRILHLKWPDDTHVVVMLQERAGKTKVVVSHERVQVSGEVKQLQDFWSAALDRLKDALTG